MALSALSDPAAVLAAIEEAKALGRPAFLAKYGFGPAQRFFVLHDGAYYDSKAVAGVAHGKQFPAEGPLRSGDFSGGEATVRAKLEALGFTVINFAELAKASAISATDSADVVGAEVTSLEHGHGGAGWELGRWHCQDNRRWSQKALSRPVLQAAAVAAAHVQCASARNWRRVGRRIRWGWVLKQL